MSITWKNINPVTTAVEDAAKPLDALQKSWTGAFTGFSKMIDDYQNREKDINTNYFLDKMAEYQTPEQLEAAKRAGQIAELKKALGYNVDSNVVRNAPDARLKTLQEQAKGNQEYKDFKTSVDQRGIVNQIHTYIAQGRMADANRLLMTHNLLNADKISESILKGQTHYANLDKTKADTAFTNASIIGRNLENQEKVRSIQEAQEQRAIQEKFDGNALRERGLQYLAQQDWNNLLEANTGLTDFINQRGLGEARPEEIAEKYMAYYNKAASGIPDELTPEEIEKIKSTIPLPDNPNKDIETHFDPNSFDGTMTSVLFPKSTPKEALDKYNKDVEIAISNARTFKKYKAIADANAIKENYSGLNEAVNNWYNQHTVKGRQSLTDRNNALIQELLNAGKSSTAIAKAANNAMNSDTSISRLFGVDKARAEEEQANRIALEKLALQESRFYGSAKNLKEGRENIIKAVDNLYPKGSEENLQLKYFANKLMTTGVKVDGEHYNLPPALVEDLIFGGDYKNWVTNPSYYFGNEVDEGEVIDNFRNMIMKNSNLMQELKDFEVVNRKHQIMELKKALGF